MSGDNRRRSSPIPPDATRYRDLDPRGGRMATDTTTKRFTGKVAVVTGSSAEPSIGRSSALRLGHEGASVVINGRDESTLAATERYLPRSGDRRGVGVGFNGGRSNFGSVDRCRRRSLRPDRPGDEHHRGRPLPGFIRRDGQGRSDEHRRVQYMARPGARSGRPAPGAWRTAAGRSSTSRAAHPARRLPR